MKLLLDTHAWIWAVTEPRRLGRQAAGALRDPAHEVLVSAVSFWELAVLVRKDRVRIPGASVGAWAWRACEELGAVPVGLDPETALRAEALDGYERGDPADRLILATAIGVDAAVVTRDRWMRAWGGVPVVW